MFTFQDFYESYATEVYCFAFWLAGGSFDAEDITSETFIRAWVNHSTIRTETLKAYLFTIARNIYLEQQRKRKRQVALEDIHPDPAPGPDRLTEAQVELQRAQQFLQTLPEIDRAAFVLRVQHELPYVEIARVLGLSLAAAKVKVHRLCWRESLCARAPCLTRVCAADRMVSFHRCALILRSSDDTRELDRLALVESRACGPPE